MANRQNDPRPRGGPTQGSPVEIPLTDLEADIAPEAPDGMDAVGTAGGGTASGGLAGTNAGDGAPDEDEHDTALGSGVHDTDDEEGLSPDEQILRNRNRRKF
jgi:hypothetical protein